MTSRFCLECNNMLYPREDKEDRKLLFACRNCPYTEFASTPLVFKHQLITNIEETAGVTTGIGADPTLPRSDKECPKCHEHDVVFFQSQQKRAETTMILFFVCNNCNNIFRS
ncbi:YALIA101S02e06502g1_1 [Yarrowia lipolytica]|nr:hypothetical protein YALI1_F23364g [Yarrowia lipolytica]KAG5359962.1 DNA-directed RNA polymerase II subunit RPB9 [Yarrowia sp. C11]KAG5362704.1 DNA-directed RNA polymerase II subunit RPB9 [Yarrowia sp. B02]KAG5364387.1 DNA-directed RNA polymerase II subunit RPB9 [Yarrowia sp. E02]QNQ01081.1 DNA-directed RNA polymerase II subunit RPB9 [Yarrowia lipolytica]